MAAVLQYKWDYIAPGATVGVFIHGYAATSFGFYNAFPTNIGNLGTAFTPTFDIQLTQDQTSIHVDNTYAHTVWIKNRAAFNATGARLYFNFT
jgi:hypothetical protein